VHGTSSASHGSSPCTPAWSSTRPLPAPDVTFSAAAGKPGVLLPPAPGPDSHHTNVSKPSPRCWRRRDRAEPKARLLRPTHLVRGHHPGRLVRAGTGRRAPAAGRCRPTWSREPRHHLLVPAFMPQSDDRRGERLECPGRPHHDRLAPIIQGFFTDKLAQRRASGHTVAALPRHLPAAAAPRPTRTRQGTRRTGRHRHRRRVRRRLPRPLETTGATA